MKNKYIKEVNKKMYDDFKKEILDELKKEWNEKIEDTKREEFDEMINDFKEVKHILRARRRLTEYLIHKGFIVHEKTGELYRLNKERNCYEHCTIWDVVRYLRNAFHATLNKDDVTEAIKGMTNAKLPDKNIVKFKNIIYDMESMSIAPEKEEPYFPSLEIDYNYKCVPDEDQFNIKNYLETSLITPKKINGVLEIIGYTFTSGNKYNLLPILTGVQGSGKSVLGNIITAIYGGDKISGVSLQRVSKDTHATSGFVGKHLNIIRDSDSEQIKEVGQLKLITGNEAIPVNPKGKTPYDLPAEEVPKTIMICNNIPYIKNDKALEERFILISFEHSFRNTDEQKPNLGRDIINSEGDMEWLIYQSIEAYKKKVESGKPFALKMTAEETREFRERNTNPLYSMLRALISKVDIDAYEEDTKAGMYQFVYVDDLRFVLEQYAYDKGIPFDLPPVRSPRIINAIRAEFDMIDGYDEYGTIYKTKQRKVKGINRKYYPFLYMTEEYYTILKMKKEDID